MAKDNIVEPTTDTQFRNQIIEYFLGKDWVVADPVSNDQVNTMAYFSITNRYKGIEPKNKLLRKLKKAVNAFVEG